MGFKPIQYCYWGPDLFAEQDRQISISVDEFHFEDTTPFRVFVQVEPPEFLPIEQKLIDNHQFYHLILAWNERILKECPNAVRYVFGSTHDPGSLDRKIDPYQKQFQVSFLTSDKSSCPGHQLRQHIFHDLPFLIGQVKVPRYMSPPWLENKSTWLDDFQYSIVVENAKRNNWIASATIDCFLTKTIPLFWGCPNIGEFFNTDGIIQFDTYEELLEKLSALRYEDYFQKRFAIEENYRTAIGYLDVTKRIDNILRGLL